MDACEPRTGNATAGPACELAGGADKFFRRALEPRVHCSSANPVGPAKWFDHRTLFPGRRRLSANAFVAPATWAIAPPSVRTIAHGNGPSPGKRAVETVASRDALDGMRGSTGPRATHGSRAINRVGIAASLNSAGRPHIPRHARQVAAPICADDSGAASYIPPPP